jgi:hypothetical protein
VNLIANGTFEVDKSGWSTWSGQVLRTTDRFHGGEASLVGVGSGDPPGPRPAGAPISTVLYGYGNTKVQAGHTYEAAAWVTVGGATSPVQLKLIQKCQGLSDAYPLVDGPDNVADGEWVELSGSFTIPATCTLTEFQLYFEGPGAGVSLYIDDVTLYDVTPVTP